MTPFELSLRNELDVERQRFGNEWLFKWHRGTYDGGYADVDDFRGGRLIYGGTLFEGQKRTLYWQAVGRYLNGKVHATFQKWDQETRSYPPHSRGSSIDGVDRLLHEFVANAVRHATQTDQALRGRGHPKTDVPLDASQVHSEANAEVHRLAEAHKKLMPAEAMEKQIPIRKRIAEAVSLKPGIWGMSIDLKELFGRRRR